MHEQPTPRGAGIALSVAALAGLSVARDVPWVLTAGILGFAVLGALDDLKSQNPKLRIVIQFGLAIVVAPVIATAGSVSPFTFVLGVVVLVAAVNATNFMDGINGISGMHAIVWGVTYFLLLTWSGAEEFAPFAVVLGTIGLTFLPWNFPAARIFLGDSGSYLLGALVGLLAVVGLYSGQPLAFLGPLAIYAVDTGGTVLARLRKHESVLEPHRNHVYQQLGQQGWSHSKIATVTVFFTASVSTLAVWSLHLQGDGLALHIVLAGMIIALAMTYYRLPALVSRRLSRREES